MLNADITAAGSLVSNLTTQLTTLAGLSDPTAIAAQTVIVLTAGQAAQTACARLCGLLGVQRQANAKAALSVLLDYSSIPAPAQPIEQYALTVEAMAGQQALFSDYSGQIDRGLASYALLPARWTALSALLSAEPGLITG